MFQHLRPYEWHALFPHVGEDFKTEKTLLWRDKKIFEV